ncbi:glycosyltransferase [Phycicoccus sonneratiae]|uniref:Glycosyl transferase family 28 C-terminal domain-containing protein n=1 Tax=Phycicoccus sonneratiae TaxID=2807628 RepID=A0ABS2CQK8_9MICO|nr:glycosyltransferase [Phycicoccus sonneraticus]MBM6402085.1 hypothetical protein [Phycicoccus sonneraticus]
MTSVALRRRLEAARRTGPVLLVASTGGHLEELVRLRGRLGAAAEHCEWATFDDDQSRSLLEGERVHHVGYIGPRGYRAAVRGTLTAVDILRAGGYSAVVSTGSGIALPFFGAARAMGLPCHYIESAARAEGPSVTGRALSRFPGVHLYSQYPERSSGKWGYSGSLFDGFERSGAPAVTKAPSRVVVTLGTMRTYGFRRAVERLDALLPQVCAPDVEVLWQTGSTDVSDLGIDGRGLVPARELREAVAEADLVVAHAGVGSSLVALDAGRVPVLLPRRSVRGEHVDDHQVLISRHLDERGIAIGRDVDELTVEDLLAAAGGSVRASAEPRPFLLRA